MLFLHQQGRTQEAFDLLSHSPVKHGKMVDQVLYLTARLTCKLGDLKNAQVALTASFVITDDPKKMKLMALEEPDLKPLWKS